MREEFEATILIIDMDNNKAVGGYPVKVNIVGDGSADYISDANGRVALGRGVCR